ncbi:MAG: type II toxin-antitoxin system RelE/ParE family toxin [Pseudomonadota bacterium]
MIKSTIWLGNSLKQLKSFPEEVKDAMGFRLYMVQIGRMPYQAKPLKGIKPTVIEITCDHAGNTYRAVYTVKLGDTVYVLHCFQKKSKRGIATPAQEIDMIKKRLKEAETLHKGE